jgi:hypothetical protein
MRAFPIVVLQPLVQIGLQRLQVLVELLAEPDLAELLQYRLVEPLADAIGLRRFDLGLAVIDVVDRQVEPVVMRFPFAAALGCRDPSGYAAAATPAR